MSIINILMRNTLIFATLPLLTACVTADNLELTTKNTLTHKAYYYYGLNEERDRALIKDITGVDPVTTEWCAAFVNTILLENDIPTSAEVSPYPLMARSFLSWGEEVEEPKQGDILVFERGESGWQGHVGFYVSTKKVNGETYYNVLGGNQSNSVSIELYPESKLLSIRRFNNNVFTQKVN